jgi:hypothetical protein
MPWIKTAQDASIGAIYTIENAIQPIAARCLNAGRPHPLEPRIKYLYETRERGILWWSVTHSEVYHLKRVVRSWCARRLRNAFRDALRDRGFDEDGRLLVLDSNGNIIDKKNRLKGTLELRMRNRLVEAKYVDVVEQAGRIVDELRYQHLRPKQTTGKSQYYKKAKNGSR